MNNEQENGAGKDSVALDDLSQIFAPAWARSMPSDEIKTVSNYDDQRDSQRRDRRDQRPPRRDQRREDGERFPRRDDNRQRPPRRDQPHGDRRDRNGGNREAPRISAPRPEPLNLDIRFMPAGKALAAIVHRIQASHKAYPIRDIVKLFQKDDSSMSVRIEYVKDTDGTQKPMFQCGLCGMPGLTQEEIVAHIFKDHIGDFFDIETVEGEAPSGNFPCVARCGLTGELLGPPNHHSYARRVHEMLHDRFPGMTEEEYRKKIEIVRDPEAVEQWRNEAKKRIVYRLKPQKSSEEAEVKTADAQEPADTTAAEAPAADAPAAEAPAEAAAAPEVEAVVFDRFQAEQYFQREIIPQNVKQASHIICPAVSLQQLANRRLAALLSAKFAEEENPRYKKPAPQKEGESAQSPVRRQGSLFTAIHAAFHHRKLHFFRVGDERGQEFVMAAAPAPFDTTHATPELKAIVEYVQNNPSCLVMSLIEALNPEKDEAKTKHLLSDINWLIERNNLIQFFNGALSQPAQHPVFKLHTSEKKQPKAKDQAASAATESEAQVEEAVKTDSADAPAQESSAAPATEPKAQAEEAVKTDSAEAPAQESPADPAAETEAKADDTVKAVSAETPAQESPADPAAPAAETEAKTE